MKKYSVEVTVTVFVDRWDGLSDFFIENVEVEAESLEEAEALAEERVTEGISDVHNSYAYAYELNEDGQRTPRANDEGE